MTQSLCHKCGELVVPKEWDQEGWGAGPYGGLGICGCAAGIPRLKAGDIIIDGSSAAFRVREHAYGMRVKNIIMILRPSWLDDGRERFDVIFNIKGAENETS